MAVFPQKWSVDGLSIEEKVYTELSRMGHLIFETPF